MNQFWVQWKILNPEDFLVVLGEIDTDFKEHQEKIQPKNLVIRAAAKRVVMIKNIAVEKKSH